MPALLHDVEISLEISGRDVSESLAPFVKRIEVSTNAESEADSFSCELYDPDGRFLEEWLPPISAKVKFSCRYTNGDRLELPSQSFEIDAPEGRITATQGATLSLKGKSVPVSKPLGTKGTKEYEDTDLAQIATEVATEAGMTIRGEVPERKLKRVTRKDETPLAFLRRLSDKYGLILKVQNADQIVFWDLEKLDAQPPAFTSDVSEFDSVEWRRNSREKYKKAVCTYSDPLTGETYIGEATAGDVGEGTPSGAGQEDAPVPEESTKTEDVLQIQERCTSNEEAEAIARAKLRRANADELEITLKGMGDPRFQPGVMFGLTGLGQLSGNFLVQESRHNLSDKGGWGFTARAERRGASLDDGEFS